MQTIPKKQAMAKAPIKVAATPTQKSSSSEESSSEEEEQKKPVKKKPGDWTQGIRLSNPPVHGSHGSTTKSDTLLEILLKGSKPCF